MESKHTPIGVIRLTSDRQKFHTSSSRCLRSDRKRQNEKPTKNKDKDNKTKVLPFF